jgi:dGTPase
MTAVLANYACQPELTRGRRHAEHDLQTNSLQTHSLSFRNPHQRDRDRIVHSTAFRRLVYKTQVFLNHEGDLFRTRMTHSLEVAQLGRSIARALSLNEDLVEAIALAHDLGHTPFGHAGQDALNECMAPYGGFEHNLQSLRVVDELEERYPAFNGLNLSFETREGILKHCARRNAELINAQEPGGVAARFLNGTQPSLEAQLCNLADAIAYNAHDIDDGVRSGLLTFDQLQEVPLFARYQAQTLRDYPQLTSAGGGRRVLYETIRRMLSDQVYDVIQATRDALAKHQPDSADAVRQCPPLVQFSAAMHEESKALKSFLFRNLYRHPQVMATTDWARDVVRTLFNAYLATPKEMPVAYAQRADVPRAVADYLSGMTDRFATREHARLVALGLI